MTDLEMTRLCAEAVGLQWKLLPALEGSETYDEDTIIFYDGPYPVKYNPIMNDAQAMALVKKCGLSLCSPSPENADWQALKVWTGDSTTPSAFNKDLNRAIVECVAKMQASK